MKKIIIAYATYGGGHLSAAKNIKEYIEKHYPNCEIMLFDFMKYINKVVDKVSGSTYSTITTNFPWAWGKIYYHTQEPILERIISLSNKVLSYKLRKVFKDFKPDIIISTHFFFGHMCSILKQKQKINAKLATIITDYGQDPYNEWIKGHEYMDYIFVAHNEMKNKLIEKKVSPEKIFVTGIPVSEKFLKQYNKKIILNSIGLNENKKTILFFGGGELGLGKSKTASILNILSSKFPSYQVIAVAGKNENLKNKFETIVLENNRQNDIKVFGFTDRVAEFMYVSNIVITKPGGLTSTESLVSDLPIIAINPIPGQESENAEILEKIGVAIWIRKNDDIYSTLNDILTNEKKLSQMKQNIKLIAKPNATENICKLILND